jgi:hypothetical protein
MTSEPGAPGTPAEPPAPETGDGSLPTVEPAQPGGVPAGIEPLGVPAAGAGNDAFVLILAVVVALLALIFTLGWIVYHQLVVDAALATWRALGKPL